MRSVAVDIGGEGVGGGATVVWAEASGIGGVSASGACAAVD